jgi:hypothetical protein
VFGAFVRENIFIFWQLNGADARSFIIGGDAWYFLILFFLIIF